MIWILIRKCLSCQTVLDFASEDVKQPDLFQKAAPSQKKTDAMKTIDRINQKYDKDAVFFAAEGILRNFRSQRANASPKYTTSWNELLRIRTDLPSYYFQEKN